MRNGARRRCVGGVTPQDPATGSPKLATATIPARAPGDRDAGGRQLPYATASFVALGHVFRILTTDRDVGAYLDHIYSGLAAPGSPSMETTTYWVVTTDDEPWPYSLHVDGRQIGSGSSSYILDYLFWHVNRQAIERSDDLVLLHAAGVERNGVCIVLPAPMECGKTTLAAGLVRHGFSYLTDEAVAIDPSDLTVRPFAKPLSVDPGSWEVLADLEPTDHEAIRSLRPNQWQIPVTSIAPDALAQPRRPRLVISPVYRGGSTTEIQPVRRAEMLLTLMDLTFNFREQPTRNMDVLRSVLVGTDCYRMTVGDLEAACQAIIDLVDGVPDTAGRTR